MHFPSERRSTNCTIAIICAFAVQLGATEQSYDPDITKWQEVQAPPKSRPGDWIVWSYAANYSPIDWQIKRDGNIIRANQTSNPIAQSSPRPNFVPKAGRFAGGFAVQKVDDGWLVGFNDGEFGAALYWFSGNGQMKYKISDDQVVDFIAMPHGIIAIQGLAHLSMSQGSLIRIARDSDRKRWRSTTVQKLTEAPEAFVRLTDGTLIIILSDSLVSLSPQNKLTTLIKCADWGGLYANSAVLSPDESKVYVGMRQFVGEYDLGSKKLKYLIPNQTFLNKLPRDQEERLRNTYKDGFAHEKDCD
jgi:hypothetical protein